jgi:hypothetical protein
MSQMSPKMDLTSSSKRSNCLLSSSPDVADSFPEPVPATGGIVAEPGETDIRLSRV